ncbi:hypothetical protein Q7P37_009212 [Cladosporium fusiforme]
MARFLGLLMASCAIVVHGLPQQQAESSSIDTNNPNKSDPSSVPDKNFTLPESRTPEPFVDGIPELPEICDSEVLSEECLETLDKDEQGAKLHFQKNHGCSDEQQRIIKNGFWDAQDLLKYAAKFSTSRSSRDYVSADYWIGSDWREYESRIKGNLGRASKFVNDKSNKKHYITFTCKDPKGYCAKNKEIKKDKDKKVIGGYAWSRDWLFWTYGYINMCDPYYTLDDIPAKIDYLNYLRAQGEVKKLQDMRYYQTLGQYIAHEMMHLNSTSGSEPHIQDLYIGSGGSEGKFVDKKAYGPQLVHRLAHGEAGTSVQEHVGGEFSTVNADSYAQLINSIFWWDPTLDPPPLLVFPSVHLGNDTDISIESIDDKLKKDLDSYFVDDDSDDSDADSDTDASGEDDSGKDDENSDNPEDDAEDAEDEDGEGPAPPEEDINACHGVHGDYWVMSRDLAVENVEDFCSQGEQTKRYNEGSVDELELSVKNLDGSEGGSPEDAPDCVGRFTNAVIDGCDSGDSVNNPHNYKFGSTLTTTDNWEYTMTPWSKQVNEVNCDVTYKFWYDHVEIRGKNFPDAKLGADGEGLKHEISGCGAVSKWNFERTPDDCCFQWYASAQLPIGTKSCAGRAVESAGGSGKGNCKRERDSIDDWPGYGDEGRHVFGGSKIAKRDGIDSWPGYGDEGKHVFKHGHGAKHEQRR